MIRRIYIDNFRCLVNFDLKLEPLTLLLGPNGSGKSTVFEAVHRLRSLVMGNEKLDQLFPLWELTRWGSRPSLLFGLEVEVPGIEGVVLTYSLAIEYVGQQWQPRINTEWLRAKTAQEGERSLFEFKDGMADLRTDSGTEMAKYPCDPATSALAAVPERPDNTLLTWFKRHIAGTLVCSINPFNMELLSTKEARYPDRYLHDFPSWYRHLVQEQQSNMFDLTTELRRVIPGFNQFRLTQLSEDYRALNLVFGDGKAGAEKQIEVGITNLSDGQRVLIALYTMLYGLKGQRCNLFVDEPENFVSLDEIQPWLMAVRDLCGKEIPQTVLISHHPEVIDYFGGDENVGIWIEREPNGPARIGKRSLEATPGLTLSETISRGWLE
jgi:predicted ATPase